MRQLSKPVLFFHSTRPNSKASAKDEERTRQLGLLGPFLKEVKSWGLINQCHTVADFERQLSIQLFNNYSKITGDTSFATEQAELTLRSEQELNNGSNWSPKKDRKKFKASARIYARAEKEFKSGDRPHTSEN